MILRIPVSSFRHATVDVSTVSTNSHGRILFEKRSLEDVGLLGQDYMVGPNNALDPSKYYIVTFALFSNGEVSV